MIVVVVFGKERGFHTCFGQNFSDDSSVADDKEENEKRECL